MLTLGLSTRKTAVPCGANGVPMIYRLFREADTWLVAIDFPNVLPPKASIYREFTSAVAACRWANSDFQRRQTLRLIVGGRG